MNLKRRDLVIGIMLICAFVILGINASALAATNDTTYLNWVSSNQNASNTQNIVQINSNQQTVNVSNGNNTNTLNAVNNTNTPGQLANTGLENAPWLIIGVCVVSAIFAYKKVREYKLED